MKHMSQEELRKKCAQATKVVARMGCWDGVIQTFEDGEPTVVAILQKPPITRALLKLGIVKHPELPERIHGVRCRVDVRERARY